MSNQLQFKNFKVFSRLMGVQTMRATSFAQLMRFIREDGVKVYKIVELRA